MRENHSFKKLEEKVNNCENGISSLKAVLYHGEGENSKNYWMHEKKKLENALSKRRQTINQELKRNAILQGNLKTAQKSLEFCRRDKAALERKCASLKAAPAQPKAQLDQEPEALLTKVTEITRERDALLMKNTGLLIDRLALQKRSTELKAERDTLREKNTTIEKEKDIILAENFKLRSERDILRARNTKNANSYKSTPVDLFELENPWVEVPKEAIGAEYMDAPEWNIYTGLCPEKSRS
jgi:chromosome segregation ATPase